MSEMSSQFKTILFWTFLTSFAVGGRFASSAPSPGRDVRAATQLIWSNASEVDREALVRWTLLDHKNYEPAGVTEIGEVVSNLVKKELSDVKPDPRRSERRLLEIAKLLLRIYRESEVPRVGFTESRSVSLLGAGLSWSLLAFAGIVGDGLTESYLVIPVKVVSVSLFIHFVALLFDENGVVPEFPGARSLAQQLNSRQIKHNFWRKIAENLRDNAPFHDLIDLSPTDIPRAFVDRIDHLWYPGALGNACETLLTIRKS